MMMKFQMHLKLFLLIGVLPIASQSIQNESSITPSPTLHQHTGMKMTLSPSATSSSSSSVSPTKNNEAGDSHSNEGVIKRPREFKGRFTISNIAWKSQYANVKSPEYTSLKLSLEKVLNNALENKISGFVMCVVQWFNKGSVITDFVIYVKENAELSSEGLERIMSDVSSSGTVGNFSLRNVVMELQPTQENEPETDAPLMIELWKIISIGGLLIVFILLIFILGLLIRNRLLRKALTRERRSNEERHQRMQIQRRQVETREALSIIAASSTDELSTFLQNDNGMQGDQRLQSRSFSMGTSRSMERLVNLLRNSEQLAAQRHHTDTLVSYDEALFQPQRAKQAQAITNKDQDTEDAHLNNKNKKSEFRSGSMTPSALNRSTQEDNLNPPASENDVITPRNDLHSKPKVSFAEPSQENTVLPAREEKQKDQLPKDKTDEETTGRDNPENQLNETKNKAIRSQVQVFQKAADTNEEEREKEKIRHETRKEPKKLKHISFHNTSSTQPDILEERRKREEEIRPLGGVIRRFTVNPFHQPSSEKTGDEQ